MSFTQLGYPSAFASEGDPSAHGGLPGDFDPYVHSVKDTMDVDDETGKFSLEVRRPPKLCCATVIDLFDSIWLVSPSSPLRMLWNRPGGTTSGGRC
jgi:leucyl aminopeptidase